MSEQAATDDPENVSRLLTAVRGAPPLYCELAARLVDGRVWWSGSGTSLIAVDSASAALIRWVHRKHADARVVPRLAAGLRDDDRCVRRVAGALLGHVDVPAAFATLVEALDHSDEGTRAAAVIGLGLSDDDRAVQPLIRRLRDASADVRRSAAWALGAIENRAAMLPLIELLERESDARVREAAAWAIGEVTGS
jgi:HEAT repeat protein